MLLITKLKYIIIIDLRLYIAVIRSRTLYVTVCRYRTSLGLPIGEEKYF